MDNSHDILLTGELNRLFYHHSKFFKVDCKLHESFCLQIDSHSELNMFQLELLHNLCFLSSLHLKIHFCLRFHLLLIQLLFLQYQLITINRKIRCYFIKMMLSLGPIHIDMPLMNSLVFYIKFGLCLVF